MKKRCVVSGFLLLLLCACTQSSGGPNSSPLSLNSSLPSRSEHIIRIEASNGSCTPTSIAVKEGDRANINLFAMAGTNDFTVSAFNIHIAALKEGYSAGIGIPTDKTGTFEFLCGPAGKKGTKGQIVIMP